MIYNGRLTSLEPLSIMSNQGFHSDLNNTSMIRLSESQSDQLDIDLEIYLN